MLIFANYWLSHMNLNDGAPLQRHATASATYGDEIDLGELALVLAKGWRLILVLIVAGLVIAALFLASRQETWTSTARVNAPGIAQVKDFLSQQRQVESVGRGATTRHEDVAAALFEEFIVQVDQPENQSKFLTNNRFGSITTLGRFDVQYPKWQDTNPFYVVKFTAGDPEVAQAVLADYLDRANRTTVQSFYNDLRDQVDTRSVALRTERDAIGQGAEAQKQSRLPTLSAELPDSRATHADDLTSILPVRYHELEKQLQLLSGLANVQSPNVQAYRYQQEPSLAARPNGGSATLLLVLGAIVGGMLGVFAVLGLDALKTYKARANGARYATMTS